MGKGERKRLARQRQQQIQQLRQFAPTSPPKMVAGRLEAYQGLVPHPEHAERYEALLPGSTERFISMAERQSEHRQSMEKRALWFHGTTQVLGVIFAAAAILGGMAEGGYLILHDKSVEGFASFLAPLAVVAGVFMKARSNQSKETSAKQ